MTTEQAVDMVLGMKGNARNIADYIIEAHNHDVIFARAWFEGYVCCAVYFKVITSDEHDQLFELMKNLDQ